MALLANGIAEGIATDLRKEDSQLLRVLFFFFARIFYWYLYRKEWEYKPVEDSGVRSGVQTTPIAQR